MSIKGSPYARFQRSLQTRNLSVVLSAAREPQSIQLDDALEILVLMAAEIGTWARKMRRKGGPSVAPRGGQKGGRPWLAPGYPSLSGCPLMVQRATARRVGGNRLRHRVVARCHQ